MHRLRSGLVILKNFVNILLISIAPMFAVLFVIGIIMLLEDTGAHHRLVTKFEQNGIAALANVDQITTYDGSLQVVFTDAGAKERRGRIKASYYPPEVWQSYIQREQVEILYLPESYEYEVVLRAEFGYVQGYWGFAVQELLILAVSWFFIILHPEFLYLGYVKDLHELYPPGRRA